MKVSTTGNGRLHIGSILIGEFPKDARMKEHGKPYAALAAVATNLRRRHHLKVRVQPNGLRKAWLKFNEPPRPFLTTGPYGTVIRVMEGDGQLQVGGNIYDLHYGEWVCIPYNRQFRLSPVNTSGLEIVFADLAAG